MQNGDKVYEIGFPCETDEDCALEDDICVGLGLCYTNKLMKTAIRKHNKHRSELALGKVKNKMDNHFPTAGEMYEMTISLEYEAMALRSAQDWQKDPTGMSGTFYKYTNDTWASRIVIDDATDEVDAMEKAMKIWWKNRKLVDDEDMKVLFEEHCYSNRDLNPFVVMAKWSNSLMGCAVDKRKKKYNVVCYYEVGRSASYFEKLPLYVPGKPCERRCHNNKSSRYCSKGLCPSYAAPGIRVWSDDWYDANL
ncbi:unnamed protein product [Nippostrongylus brasiliensis]|uniref:SCP domain-containing protein n=1 Tax=Nippostrongylus brasiliensis TaxID=27835 RepID=A0A0N4Y1R0_NIPBR|nr:unnamed protein product [Nippostrongylus brasiliensis]